MSNRIGWCWVPFVPQGLSRARLSRMVGRALAYLTIAVGAVIFLSPLAWLISTALGSAADVIKVPHVWIPRPLHWENFQIALTGVPFARYTLNTLIITVTGVTGTLLSTSLVAYGFARLRFPGRDILFLILLSTMMLPGQVLLVPMFVLFKNLGWYDTFLPLIVPQWLGGSAFGIFLIRQFFMSLPLELDDAARIDGCGSFRIWWSILLPLSKPVLATVSIFSFLSNWNDFLGPLIYVRSPANQTFALALAGLGGIYETNTQLVMAAAFTFMLPCLALVFLAQRYIVQGLAFTGLAGK